MKFKWIKEEHVRDCGDGFTKVCYLILKGSHNFTHLSKQEAQEYALECVKNAPIFNKEIWNEKNIPEYIHDETELKE